MRCVYKAWRQLPERLLRKEAFIGADGLPRPIRGREPRDAESRRKHRRRFGLQQLGLEVASLPPQLQQLVLEHNGALEPDQRRLLVSACLARGLSVGRVGLVLNLLGDEATGEQLQVLAHAYARSKQLPDNFEVLSVERFTPPRQRTKWGPLPHYRLRLRIDGRPEVAEVEMSADALVYGPRFAARCVDQAGFMPLFRDRGPRSYAEFVASLMPLLREDASA